MSRRLNPDEIRELGELLWVPGLRRGALGLFDYSCVTRKGAYKLARGRISAAMASGNPVLDLNLRPNQCITPLMSRNAMAPRHRVAVMEHLRSLLQTSTTLRSLIMYWDIDGRYGVSEYKIIASMLRDRTSLRSISFEDLSLPSELTELLFGALKESRTLQILNFGGNNVSDSACGVLAGALRVNESLTELGLRRCMIGTGGCIAIADALKDNASLRVLRLGLNNNIGSGPACGALADAVRVNESLSELDLDRCNVDAAGCTVIANALKCGGPMRTLGLRGRDTWPWDTGAIDAIAAAVRRCVWLVKVDISERVMTQAAVDKINAAYMLGRIEFTHRVRVALGIRCDIACPWATTTSSSGYHACVCAPAAALVDNPIFTEDVSWIVMQYLVPAPAPQ